MKARRKGRRGQRTARAIEVNAGVLAAYQRAIVRLMHRVRREFVTAIIDFLRKGANPPIAQDADPRTILDTMRDFISGLFGRAAAKLRGLAQQLTARMSGRQARETVRSQREALRKAGISPRMIDDAWSVPQVHGQHLSPQAARELPSIISENTSLITKLAASELNAIQSAVMEGMEKGLNIDDLEATLKTIPSMDAARAKRVALDQLNKVSQSVQRANCESLGMTKAVWIHVPGQYTSRESHIAMNGKTFDLREGMYDPEIKRNVQCAELPFCRCIFRTVIPEELLADE